MPARPVLPSARLCCAWFFPGWRLRVAAWPWLLRWPLQLAVGATGLGLAAILIGDLAYRSLARRYDLDSLGRMPARSEVYDARGGLLGKLHGEDRRVVPLSQVAPDFIKALLAREDSRFYEHGGVDLVGVVRAVVRTLQDPKVRQGASTITMQLARNSFDLTREKSLHRKLLEMAITRRIEDQRSKAQILELYVNRIFFGTGLFGVERAAESYFGKSALGLTLDESAMLAAIIRGPNAFSPFRHYEVARSGRDMVLDRMVATGVLSAAAAAAAKRVKTKVLAPPQAPPDSWALDAVRRDLEKVLDQGEVGEGGLKIYTTLEPELQRAAEESLNRQLAAVEKGPGYPHQTWALYERLVQRGLAVEPEYLQGAVILLENHTGAIRAAVGGRDIRHSGTNRALQSRRQVGSAFQPLVYAAAVERAGLWPGQLIFDGPLLPGEVRGEEGLVSPANADGRFGGWQSAWWGLAKSRHTMAVRVGELAGVDQVKQLAAAAGLSGIAGRSPQLYLGNLGATLESLSSAFSLFGNGGQRCRPFLIDRIETGEGELVYRSGVIAYPVLSPGSAWLTTRMMEQVLGPEGTAAGVQGLGFRGLAAGQTGSADDFRDAWFIGYSTALTCGVWVGLDDTSRRAPQGYGSRLALPIWAEVMARGPALGYAAGASWPSPGPVEKVAICAVSGLLGSPGCGGAAAEVELPSSHVPREVCRHQEGRGAAAGGAEELRQPGFWQRLGQRWR